MDRLAENALQLVGHGNRRLFVGARKGNDELVATDAPGEARGFDAAFDPVGDDPQEMVTTTMTERVVDRLEAVEIEEQHTDGLLRPGLADECLQRLEHTTSIEQPRQCVVGGLVLELLDRVGQLRIGLGQFDLVEFDFGEQVFRRLL